MHLLSQQFAAAPARSIPTPPRRAELGYLPGDGAATCLSTPPTLHERRAERALDPGRVKKTFKTNFWLHRSWRTCETCNSITAAPPPPSIALGEQVVSAPLATPKQPIYINKALIRAETTCQHLKTNDRLAPGAGTSRLARAQRGDGTQTHAHPVSYPRLVLHDATPGTLLALFSIYRSLSEMALLSEQMSKN